MRQILLQTCVLDRAGIPDLSDFRWIRLDARSIIAITVHVAYDYWSDPVRAYPFAAIETRRGLLFCACEPEIDEAKLSISMNVLRAGLGAR